MSTRTTKTHHTKEWWEGYHTQQPRTRNPYSPTSPEADEWILGWLCRYYGEKP